MLNKLEWNIYKYNLDKKANRTFIFDQGSILQLMRKSERWKKIREVKTTKEKNIYLKYE